MSWLIASAPILNYPDEQLSTQLSALSTLPVSIPSSPAASTFTAPPPASSAAGVSKPSPVYESALNRLSTSIPPSRSVLVDVLKCLNRDGLSASEFSTQDEGRALEAEIMGRAVTIVWKEVLQALIECALALEEERSWWESSTNSRRDVAVYLVQSLPLRIYRAIEPAQFSLTSLKSFQFPKRSALFRPLPNASTALSSISSPYTLIRREMLTSIKNLTASRDSMAKRIGMLATDGPRWNEISSFSGGSGSEYGAEVARLYGTLCSVLEIPNPAAATPTSKRSSRQIFQPSGMTASTATPSSLLAILNTFLPRLRAATDHTLQIHSRPNAMTRLWFPLLFVPPAVLFTARTLVRNRAWFEEQIRNARETVQGFFVSWVWEPLEGIGKTLRGGGEGLGVAPTTVKSDQESLERMVMDLGRDYYKLDGPQLDVLRDKVASGNMEEVLRVYEKEMQSPVKNALLGNLIRTLLIQVQKTKTDLSLSLLSLDHLLRSQQLTFAFVGLAPSLLVLYGLGGWLRGVLRGEKRGKGRRRRYFNGIREIERILLTASKNNQDLPDRDRGLLIISITGMRSWAAGLSGNSRQAFLGDLRLVEDTSLSRGDKLRVVERIWRCFGVDGRRVI